MDKKLPIRSIQNLSKVHTAMVPDQLLEYAQQQQQQQQQQQRANFEEQIQHIAALQQQQQQQQQQHQQMLAHHQQQQLQQLFFARLPFPTQSVPAISPSQNGLNGNNTNNNHTPTKQSNSRNSSSATKNRNGVTKKETAVSNHSNGLETGLIDLITCTLCKGYLIDATTLELCMHSFCRPCALKYIRDNHRCPKCNIEIKDKRFLNRLKSDTILQSIVYKLVPGLYEKEMARRREFYATRPSPTPRYKCEMFGDIPPAKSIKPDDMLNVSLTWLKGPPDDEPVKTYLFCRADSTLLALKKLIIGKFGLERPIKFYYDKSEIHFDITALMDIAATFDWSPERKILALNFREQDLDQDETNQKLENHTSTNSSPLMSSDRDP